MMRNTFLLLITLFLTLSVKIKAQDLSVRHLDEPRGNGYTEELFKIVLNKKYLTESYDSGYVDDFKELASLRYNIYEDEMEFVKGETIYFLKKEIGRRVQFSNLTTDLYKVYELNDKAQFFLVHMEGKNSLLAKQSIKFIEAKKSRSTYANSSKLANFKRKKDKLYLVKNDSDLIEIPTKKKKFYSIFDSKANSIKAYMEENKLGHKKVKDLKKIITYYNTL